MAIVNPVVVLAQGHGLSGRLISEALEPVGPRVEQWYPIVFPASAYVWRPRRSSSSSIPPWRSEQQTMLAAGTKRASVRPAAEVSVRVS
jgi:hypothetical protein